MKAITINQAWNGAEKCDQCPIRHLVLFADLQQEDFSQLHQPINDMDFRAGSALYQENESAQFVYTIRSGMVKLIRYLPNGSYRIVRLLQLGDLAGIEALNGSKYQHHAVILQHASVCRIPIEDIERLNFNSPHLYKQLTARWQKVQQDADIWLAELTVGNSKKRVASLLMYLANSTANQSFFLPSREDIGAILAITTETASRIIAEFKRLGYLKTEQQNAFINQAALEKINQ
ncbi:MAG: cyclic nucleotide-binding domain-containing protein [Methyloprofundus sp.]|nr:cyclic nucleotide-binding domain-containing protein [Methyloprofundus sp.]